MVQLEKQTLHMIINTFRNIQNRYETVKLSLDRFILFSFQQPSVSSKVLYILCDRYAWSYVFFHHKTIRKYEYM